MTESETPPGATGYSAAGVDYETLDAGKRLAIAGALSTSALLEGRGGHALDSSRGEPAFVFELDGRTLAFVVEGLGTKSVIARQVLEAQGINRFGDVAYDTVAAILNDLCCVGALPVVVNAYFATGASEWYREGERGAALIEGWRRACVDAGCTWGGGESPSLPGLLDEREIELAGAAVGAVPEGRRALLGEELEPGDEIVLVASSGLHANGASLARLLAGRLPDGYATELAADRAPSGAAATATTGPDAGANTVARTAGTTTLGEALLAPSVMYVGLVAALIEEELPLRYISHITGHGLLKLMRPSRALTYRIERLPEVPAVLRFLVEQARLDAHAAYSTFNMGSGYALYCAPGAGEAIVAVAERLGLSALVAGSVEEGPRQVILEPVDVRFAGEELELG
ncbi:MAG TPA: AIR synthase related protein [Solirubrobacteraceae bacterium]|jgi:phosphoribosylformylglycinamidine cyclo-ligase